MRTDVAEKSQATGQSDTAVSYQSFSEFWPFYVYQHRNPTCRRLHWVGTLLTFVVVAVAVTVTNYWLLLLMPVVGYGFAWVGHFVFEKNRPATFQYPFYSLVGDYLMFFKMSFGQMSKEVRRAEQILGSHEASPNGG